MPLRRAAETITEPARQTPVTLQCQVLVIGCGIAGCNAAKAAAKAGARVIAADAAPLAEKVPRQARLRVRSDCRATAAAVRAGRITHVVCEGAAGRFAIACEAVIDTTADLRIAALAGERLVRHQPPLRGVRLAGRRVLTGVESDCRFEDAVGACPDPNAPGAGFWIPLGILVGRRIRNLFIAGKGAAATGMAAVALATDLGCAASGSGAGAAAALLVQDNLYDADEIELPVLKKLIGMT